MKLDWDTLLSRINSGRCTPVLGAGASAGSIDTATKIARDWADRWKFPLPEREDLSKVSQFLSIHVDPLLPRDIVSRLCRDATSPNYDDKRQIHRVLADLPFPQYITTNYDNFMMEALQRAYYWENGIKKSKKPYLETCRWFEAGGRPNGAHARTRSGLSRPTAATPLVFHLHGHCETPQSMVLTEDDYLSFLAWMTRRSMRGLPSSVVGALGGSSLMFIGYSHRDWSFRVLFRSIVESVPATLQMLSISVQLPPETTNATQRHNVQLYLEKYYSTQNRVQTVVYWESAATFAGQLRDRWEKRYGQLP